MNNNDWEALKQYINIHLYHGRKAISEIEDVRLKQQLQVKVSTFEEILKVMKSYEDYNEENNA